MRESILLGGSLESLQTLYFDQVSLSDKMSSDLNIEGTSNCMASLRRGRFNITYAPKTENQNQGIIYKDK